MTGLRRAGKAAAALAFCLSAAAAAMDEAGLDRRIDSLRKGDFIVLVRDAAGRPVTNQVRYALARHEFPFGTAVSAKWLLADPQSDPDAQRYQEILRSHFNCAVAENAHKWYVMEPERGKRSDEEALAVWQKCRELGLPMRGHCVLWGVTNMVQPWVKQLPPPELQDAVRGRIRHVLELFQGRIAEWDLNNEMMHGDYYARTLGFRNGAVYFRLARRAVRGNVYYVNDYGALDGAGAAGRYAAHIRDLLDSGAPVGGIGEQAHFSGNVPPTDELWSNLNTLGKFRLPVKITEFDLDTADEARQADDTRRFYKVCFAHPSVQGILMWGFWEGAHWRPKAALWRQDWSVRPNGQAYLDLMREWRTRGTATPDKPGRFYFRGFYGEYEVSSGGQTGRVTLHQRGKRAVTVTLQPPAQDRSR